MAGKPTPVFLERGNYRRRRRMDAIKLIAIVGGAMWMIPLLWVTPDENGAEAVSMSDALMYVFGVWLLLIVFSAILILRLRRDPDVEDRDGPEQ